MITSKPVKWFLIMSGLCLSLTALGQAAPIDDPLGNYTPGESAQPRGVIRTAQQATISAQIAGQIIQLPFRDGMIFNKGDILIAFDCRRPKADYKAARAAIEIRQRAVETNQELEKFQSIGKYELLISRAELHKAQAEAESLRIVLDGCVINAPFNGRVSQNLAHQYEAVTLGQPILDILSTEMLEIEVIVPSEWLLWLTPGAPFTFTVDETNAQLSAEVSRLSPAVDPVSKTIKVIGQLSQQANEANTPLVLPGMSGTARFARP